MKRRLILKGTLASGAVAIAVTAGLLSPRKVLAAWSKPAFEAKNVQEGMKNALGQELTDPSDGILIKAPEIAENGAVVPVTVSTKLANPESISVFVENNPTPLTAMFKLSPNTSPTVSTRVKMLKTSNVIAVVKAGGKLYSTRKEVKVTIGGCGG